MEETIELYFLEPGVIENPVYDAHKRSKNWAGVLMGKNSVHFELNFLPSRGSNVSVDRVGLGHPIEFGGDYVTGSGKRVPDRLHGVVVDIDSEKITIKKMSSREEAMKNRFNID